MSAALAELPAQPGLVERVHGALRDAIGDGTLAPGARITQEDLAARLAVSRQPVLQALRLLKQEGLVLDAPGRGLLVAPLDAERIADVYEVRAALDGLAARLAAQRRAVLDPQLLERGRRAARGRDIRAMVEADEAFHHAIYAASGNPLVAQSAQPHWVQLRRVMAAVLQSSRQREPIWDEHAAIADAIARGAAAEAARRMEEHARQASEHLRARLAELAPPPATRPHAALSRTAS